MQWRHGLGSSSLFMQREAVSTGRKQNFLPNPQMYQHNSTIFSELFGTLHFFSFRACGNQKILCPRNQDSSSQQLETFGSHKHLPVIYQLLSLLNVIQKLPFLSLAPTPLLLPLMYFRVIVHFQNKDTDATRQKWTKYFAPSFCKMRVFNSLTTNDRPR